MKTLILDHGSVELVETWGSDERIIEAARMSTGKGFLGWGAPCQFCEGRGHRPEDKSTGTDGRANYTCNPCQGTGRGPAGDEKLLAFLWNNRHATPFEMAGMVIEVQAPIFVFREWHRHRTQSYNELSARYTPLPAVDYVPSLERVMINASTTNKQAGTIAGAAVLTEKEAHTFRFGLATIYEQQEEFYQRALAAGVPKELARIHLPVGRYSRMRASANLRNWLAFLTLRMDPAAQWEIRQYANAVGDLIAAQFPKTWELFIQGKKP